ncbi:MAG: SDR family oxidoreductase [Proteobacteria bacterium]|nr:SDR family oxidoreductase [Pseudomonadota bacterium]
MFADGLLKGKKILITGGGTGLGRAMAERFMRLGAAVVICGRREDVLADTSKELAAATGGNISWRGMDIRDPDAVETVVGAIFADGPLDGLVNNAAGNILARTETLSHRAFDAVTKIVFNGTAYVTLACAKRWLDLEHKASVVSIITTYAWTGSAYVLPSAMAKAGVLAMTRSLAVEWGGRGLRFNAIAPGPFPTDGAWSRLMPSPEMAHIAETRNPLGRVGEKDELTSLAAFLLADGSAYINGDAITIDAGEWLKGAGQFNFAEMLTDEQWAAMRPGKKG